MMPASPAALLPTHRSVAMTVLVLPFLVGVEALIEDAAAVCNAVCIVLAAR